MGNLNDLADKAFSSIDQRLARRGVSRGGAARNALTNVELERGRSVGGFLADLPFREREARFAATLPLLRMGLGFAGRGPSTQTRTRDFTQTTDVARDEEFDETSESNQTLKGPSFGRSLLGGIGGGLELGIAEGLFNRRAPGGFNNGFLTINNGRLQR